MDKPDYTSPPFRLDDLMNGYVLTQDTKDFCFGMDTVLLADFAAGGINKKDEKVCELCCGNGAAGIMMLARKPLLDITGFELRPKAAALARYNASQNELSERLNIVTCDLKEIDSSYNGGFGAVAVNPPYNAPSEGIAPQSSDAATARCETNASLDDIIYTSMRLLKDKGRLYMVHKASRLAQIISVMNKYNMQPKTLRSIHSKEGSAANLILICAAKNAGVWLNIMPPLTVYSSDGTYTKEIYEIYGMTD